MNNINPSSNIVRIDQREWGVTNSSSKTPVIGTNYIACCVALAVYAPIFRIAALAHLDDPSFSEEAVMEVIQSVPNTNELQITFIGGWKDNPDALINQFLPGIIANLAKSNPLWKIETQLFQKTIEEAYNYVGIDSRTGAVSSDDTDPVFSNPAAMISHAEAHKIYLHKRLEQTVNEPLRLYWNVGPF